MPEEILEYEAEAKPLKKMVMPPHLDELGKEVFQVQSAVFDAMFTQDKEGSLHEIVPFDEATIEAVRQISLEELIPVMDDFMANRLKFFCDNVDLGHPAMQPLLSAGFQRDSEFNKTLREIISVLNLARTGELIQILGLLKHGFIKSKSMKEVRVGIFRPPTRALKSRQARIAARQGKAPKEISLKEWFEKNKHWNDHPSSFSSFTRLNDAHREDVARNTKKSEKMASLGMTSLATSFRKRNDIIKNFLGEQYCGFTKLKMLDAAIILAKVHGGTFKEEYKTISYQRKPFDKAAFWLEPDSVYPAKDMGKDANPDTTKKVRVQACMIPDMFTFKPRAYPLHQFSASTPEHVRDMIETTEDHPDMLGKPIFDQFWVVVPGVGLATEMHNYSTRWVIRKEKTCELHDTAEDAEKSLDAYLVEAGVLHPVVLGEKDGKCFFLTYWS